MGESNTVRVDAATLQGAAHAYRTAAEIVNTAIRTHLSGLTFDSSTAGRAHATRGAALRAAVDETVEHLRQWSVASTEIASALQTTADRYAQADFRAGDRLG